MRSERTVLLVAYHFPPLRGSSGIQRTLRFAENLPRLGWRPIVLTIDERAYESVDNGTGNEIPRGLEVHRAFGVDAARSLSAFGRYPRAFALPDRWSLWRPWAVSKGLRIIKSERVDAIWSTFPIATAHRIAMDLKHRTGLPWIAEFRDPMWQGDEYPEDPVVNRHWRILEQKVVKTAERIVAVTDGSVTRYRKLLHENQESKVLLIENGYDEETFLRAERSKPAKRMQTGSVTLLHSGLVYSSERDPSCLFAAVAALKWESEISPDRLQIVLRASGNDETFRRDLIARGITDIVRLEPAVDYLRALQEMMEADGLLVLQASNCNQQVPAKLYEYLRAGRPILALTDPAGKRPRHFGRRGLEPLLGSIRCKRSNLHCKHLSRKFVQARGFDPHRKSLRDIRVPCSRRSSRLRSMNWWWRRSDGTKRQGPHVRRF